MEEAPLHVEYQSHACAELYHVVGGLRSWLTCIMGSCFTVLGEFQGELISSENQFRFQNMKDREVFSCSEPPVLRGIRESCVGKCSVSHIDGIPCDLRHSRVPAAELLSSFRQTHCLSMSVVFTELHTRYCSPYQNLLVTEYQAF
jgi:hypothetical protein